MVTKTMRSERIFVTVTSVFDSTGYMHPREIIWEDGRVFKIESIKDFRPASSLAEHLPGDCYTVVIKGEVKHLLFCRMTRLSQPVYLMWMMRDSVPSSGK